MFFIKSLLLIIHIYLCIQLSKQQKEISEMFSDTKIYPDIVTKLPATILNVTYEENGVKKNLAHPYNQTSEQWKERLLTVLMVYTAVEDTYITFIIVQISAKTKKQQLVSLYINGNDKLNPISIVAREFYPTEKKLFDPTATENSYVVFLSCKQEKSYPVNKFRKYKRGEINLNKLIKDNNLNISAGFVATTYADKGDYKLLTHLLLFGVVLLIPINLIGVILTVVKNFLSYKKSHKI